MQDLESNDNWDNCLEFRLNACPHFESPIVLLYSLPLGGRGGFWYGFGLSFFGDMRICCLVISFSGGKELVKPKITLRKDYVMISITRR